MEINDSNWGFIPQSFEILVETSITEDLTQDLSSC